MSRAHDISCRAHYSILISSAYDSIVCTHDLISRAHGIMIILKEKLCVEPSEFNEFQSREHNFQCNIGKLYGLWPWATVPQIPSLPLDNSVTVSPKAVQTVYTASWKQFWNGSTLTISVPLSSLRNFGHPPRSTTEYYLKWNSLPLSLNILYLCSLPLNRRRITKIQKPVNCSTVWAESICHSY